MGRSEGPAGYEQSFAPVPESAAAARRFVREALGQLGLSQYWDQLAVLVGELAVNAVLHGRTEFRMVLVVPAAGTVRIEIHDANREVPRQKTAVTADPLTYGRGLILVEANCDRWGYDSTPEGKLVWAEVDV